MNRKQKSLVLTILGWIFLVSMSAIILLPMFWILISGFKTNNEIFTNTFALPKEWRVSNYILAWKYGVGDYFLNSIFVTGISTAATVLISLLASFALTHSRFNFKLRNPVLIFIISGLMLAPQVALLPLYDLLSKLKIYDTYFAMVIPYLAFRISFTVFLMRAYLLSIPKELEDAAYIDGCNSLKVLKSIVMPLSKPIIATSALLTGMYCWNEFMFALVFTSSNNLRTIPLGLMNMRGTLRTEWGILIAALALSALPIIIVFILLQKQFIRGLVAGGVKG